jgi:hypothetical protein
MPRAEILPAGIPLATCDNVKARAALIDCLAPDRRVEIEVKGYKEVVTPFTLSQVLPVTGLDSPMPRAEILPAGIPLATR